MTFLRNLWILLLIVTLVTPAWHEAYGDGEGGLIQLKTQTTFTLAQITQSSVANLTISSGSADIYSVYDVICQTAMGSADAVNFANPLNFPVDPGMILSGTQYNFVLPNYLINQQLDMQLDLAGLQVQTGTQLPGVLSYSSQAVSKAFAWSGTVLDLSGLYLLVASPSSHTVIATPPGDYSKYVEVVVTTDGVNTTVSVKVLQH